MSELAPVPAEPERAGAVRRVLPAVLLSLAVIAIFAPSVAGDFIWDDRFLIQAPRGVGAALHDAFWPQTPDEGAASTASGFFRPVVSLYFALGWKLFQGGPRGFHLVSLALHLACALLAFRWISRRLGRGSPGRIAAALAVGLFAVHPSRPESVVFISGCTDVFMTLFCLLALEVWDRWRSWWATGLLLALAFLSKETAIVVPVLLAADELLGARGAERRTGGWRLGAVAALVAVAVGARFALMPVHPSSAASYGNAFLRTAATLGFYLRQVVAPWPSSAFIDPYSPGVGYLYPAWSLALGCAGAAAVLSLAVLALRRAFLRPWLADVLWLLLPLAPVLNLVPLGYRTLVAERFLYLPLLGASALCARAALALARGTKLRPAILAGLAALGLASAYGCARRVPDFLSDLGMWTHERALAPDDPDVLQEYARAQWREGEPAEALAALERAHPRARSSTRILESAVEWACISLELTPDDDEAGIARLGAFFDELSSAGNDAVVRLQTERATFTVRMSPAVRRQLEQSFAYLNHRAIAHARLGEYAIADPLLRRAAALQGKPDGGTSLLRVVALEGRWLDARRMAEEELARRPDDRPLRTLTEALRAIANRPSPSEEPAASLERAQRMLLLGEPLSAYRVLHGLVDVFPDDAPVALGAASAALALRRPDEAWAILVAAQDRMPEHAEEWQQALERVKAFAPAR